ncbi:MAG TPA: 50S ribosomal protein L31 [Coriobacteriia bacterium]|nr:50S ribosomal protein L31 [Coriobacteriia bacterium]
MRKGIHPDYVESTVTCSCGESFTTRSTKSELHIELCSKCHPFYTGTQKLVDSGGRVQRFADKFGATATNVLEREAAEREARRKTHEEAALAAREARFAKDAEKAAKAAKHDTATARAEGVTDAVGDETAGPSPAGETLAEETAE